MKTASYTQLQEKYGGKFIAKASHRVIAAARTSEALWKKVRHQIGDPDVVIEYIEPKGAICIFGISLP